MSALSVALLALTLHRPYHNETVASLATSVHTHVTVSGIVTQVTHEADGDWHLRITDGPAFVIAEIIPAIPLKVPPVGSCVTVRGIRRVDTAHGSWPEVTIRSYTFWRNASERELYTPLGSPATRLDSLRFQEPEDVSL